MEEKSESKSPLFTEKVSAEAHSAELSPIQEAKNILEENKKVLAGLQEERMKLEKITANSMLAGTAGGRVEIQAKAETPKEYADKVMNNKVPLK